MLLRISPKEASRQISAIDSEWSMKADVQKNNLGMPSTVKVSVTIRGRVQEAVAQVMVDQLNPSWDGVQGAEDAAFAKAVNRFGFDFEVDPERTNY